MADDNKTIFPLIPEKRWWILRDQFKKTIPREVTATYLKSILQLNSDSAVRNTINPLKRLGLLDEENKPTDLANDWRNDEKYSDVCKQMLERYPRELRDLFADPDVDKSRVEDWFRHSGKLGDSAARQSAALYLLLLDAQPKSSTDFIGTKKPKRSDSVRKSPKSKLVTPEPKTEQTVIEPQVAPPLPSGLNANAKDWFSLHIDLQIHISPEADADQIDNIFASMAKHIMSMRRDQVSDEGN
jgi:hypothetical protein